MVKLIKKKIVYKNKWIQITKKNIHFKYKGLGDYYSIDQKDYVYIILQTQKRLFPMVKQYRHAIDKYTLEFPSGTIEKNQKPSDCAKKEALEETGHKINKLTKIATLYPDIGRLSNRVHMFFGISNDKNIKKIEKKEEIKVFYYSKNEILNLIKNNKIIHQPHIGLFFLAKLRNLI